MAERFSLSYIDYIVFGILLIVSASIGLCLSMFGRKQKTNSDYLLAGRDMSIFPISFSLMATFISATTLIGIPSEIYLYGTNMAFMNLGFIVGPIVASFIFLPIYFKTGVLTPFEYLERRFGKVTRKILGIIYLLQYILFSGVSLYAPSLALSALTNLSLWVSVVCVAAVGTFYSTLGGMKAVIWTDMYQALLMYTCIIAIIIKGCLDLGGIQAIFKTAYDGERILVPPLQLDFSIRYTLYSIFLQGAIISTASFSGGQIQVQRQLTLRTLNRSRTSSICSIPMIIIFQLMCCLCGIIFYAYFHTCDPVTSTEHRISSYDQLLPYFIIKTMSEYPGLPGLCITGIFSVSLSTISASMNAMAAVTYQDIIKPIWPNIKKDVWITRAANFSYGVISVLVTAIVASMGNLVQASILVFGMVNGPSLGVLLLASLTTTANQWGVNIGVVTGFLVATFLSFLPDDRNFPTLPIHSNCSEVAAANQSMINDYIQLQLNTSDKTLVNVAPSVHPKQNFPLSYMWISPLALLVCLIVGYIASWITMLIKGKAHYVQLELLSPVRQRCFMKDRIDFEQQNVNSMKDTETSNKYTKKNSM